jgi:hypothetical protein
MNGEWKTQSHSLAFESELRTLIQKYDKLGGLSSYAVDRRKGALPYSAQSAVMALTRALKQAIRSGPVTYAGGSLGVGQIFEYERGGTITVSGPLWSELCLMGHWIQDALILRWAELTSRLSRGSVRPDVVVSQLLVTPDPEREIQAAREVFAGVDARECVWSGRDLRRDFVIDHVLPFSLWRNNDLWNLLPVHPKVNSQKSDKLPTRGLLRRRRDIILHYWDRSIAVFPQRFCAEAAAQTGSETPSLPELFNVLSESVEVTALQRGCERWEP